MQSAADIQHERKRHFFIFCSWIMFLTVTLLAIVDLYEKDTREFVADLVVLTVLAGGLIAIRLSKMDMTVYRVVNLLICLNFFYAVGIGAGKETVLFWAFFMPPLFFFFFGKWEGAVWAMCFYACLAVLMLAPSLFHGHNYNNTIMSRFLIAFPIVTVICFGLEASRYLFGQLLDEKSRLLQMEKAQLEQALKEIKTLGGLIPICARCKKVRNDDGFWEQVETYIRDRSEADFSHGICPECAHQLYPGLKSGK